MTERSSDSQVVVGVDTNILINFGNFRKLAWRKLFPGVTSVTVLVAAKVQSEMDYHKDHGAGYVRKRAKEFQSVLRAAENADYEVSFVEAGVNVRCVFLDRPQNSVLDGSRFDLTDADELIVAQYQYASHSWGALTVLANDASPIRAAKRAGIQALRPDAWAAERIEPEDDTTRALRERNRELERVVSARPKVELVEISVHGRGAGDIRFAAEFDYASFQSEMRRRLVDHVYLPTGEDLVGRFGKRRSDIPNFAFAPTSLWGGVSEKELQDWEKKLNSFQTHFDRVSKSQMLRLLGSLSQAYILEVKIKNEGEAPDRNVYVEFETRGAASLSSLHELESDWGLRRPVPPTRDGPLVSPLAAYMPSQRHDEHSFYRVSRNSLLQSHRCDVFMQAKEAHVFAYVLTSAEGPRPSVIVKIGAQHLLSPIVREIELTPQSLVLTRESIRRLILDRLVLMPKRQADVLGDALHVE